MSARETALQALIACRKNGAWSNGALKRLIARDRLDARDAALAARLCYGVMQNRGKLAFYLKQRQNFQPASRGTGHSASGAVSAS